MGQPKALLPFGDELMLQGIVRILGEVVNPVVIVAAPGPDVPALPADVEIVRDEMEGHLPLQGLAAGLAALQGKAEAEYLSSCDEPLSTFVEVPMRRMAPRVRRLKPSPASRTTIFSGTVTPPWS